MSRKRNRKHSKIDKLPADLKEAVDMMLKGDYTYHDVAEFIRDNAGIEISETSVWRYASNLSATLAELRTMQENQRAISEELARHPDLDTTEGLVRIMAYKLLNVVQSYDEEALKELDPIKLIREINSLVRVASYKSDMDIKKKNIKDVGFDCVKDMVFETMAREEPELYAQFNSFISRVSEGDDN